MPGTAAESTAQRVGWARAAVTAVFFTHGVLFASWTAHIPHVKAQLGLDDGTLGLALLGVPLGSVSAMAFGAWLIPRFGSRIVVLVCLTGYCLAGPLVGLTGSVAGLFGALFLWGTFQGTLDVSMNTQAITVEGVRQRPLMNGFHACWSLGAFSGAGIGTLGVALGIALSVQLLVVGVVLLFVAGWLATRMFADANPRPGAADEHERSSGRRVSAPMLWLGAIACASMLCEGAAADWSSVYLRDSLHSSAAVAGLGYTSFALAMVIVRGAGNRLLRRFPAPVLLSGLAALPTVMLTVALAIGDAPLALIGLFLLGLGLGSVVPTAFSAAGRLAGTHPGFSVSVVSGLGWTGYVLGPPIIGQLASLTSLPLALGLVPLLTAFIAVAARSLRVLRDSTNSLQPAAAAGRPTA